MTSRLDRFAALLERYQQSPEDYDAGEEEDPRPYFDSTAELSRYVCVTVNYTSHGYAKYFFLPTFDYELAAEARAVEYAQDDIFEELPVEVYDLDSGCSWKPEWRKLPFAMEEGPCTGAQS